MASNHYQTCNERIISMPSESISIIAYSRGGERGQIGCVVNACSLLHR
jgi:hypothetical protein